MQKNPLLSLVIIALVLATAACASSQGFNRGKLREGLNSGQVEYTDKEIEKKLKAKAQLPKPFKLGVYFRQPVGYKPSWRWTAEDKQAIMATAEPLKASKEVSDIFIVSPQDEDESRGNYGPPLDLKKLRLAAAQYGADALLVVSGIEAVDSYENKWSWTYIALVPMLFVKASVTDTLFLAKASLWDVRNEYLYMTAEAEATKSHVKPLAYPERTPLIRQTKSEAITKLNEEIVKMVQGLTQKKTK